MVPKNAASPSTAMTDRTGCSTRRLENRLSAEDIVSIKSSIVRTDLTSSSVSRRNSTDMTGELRSVGGVGRIGQVGQVGRVGQVGQVGEDCCLTYQAHLTHLTYET